MIKNFLTFIITLSLLLLSACGKDQEPEIVPAKRTILIYMLATNSLGSSGYDTKDIEEIEAAVRNNDLNDCRILLYHTAYNSEPSLYEYIHTTTNAEKKLVKTYPASPKSTTVERYKEVFSDIKRFAPANNYALVLWSHGAGWAYELESPVPGANMAPFFDNESLPDHRYFGEDRANYTQIDQLAEAIPDNFFSFIYFDACYMGCIEVAYQLRNKAEYMIGSTTLLPADGMNYTLNIPEFIKDTPDLKGACLNTYTHYNSQSGSNRTLTIALYDLSKIERLTNVCRNIYSANSSDYGHSGIQKYVIPSQNNCIFFDFMQYFDRQADNDATLKAQLKAATNDFVVVKYCTPYIFNRLAIDSENFSGASSYILGAGNTTNENYYKTLDWYKTVYIK